MKSKRWYGWLLVILSCWWTTVGHAQEVEPSVVSQMVSDIQQLEDIEQYRIQYQLTNLDDGRKVATATIIGNKKSNDAKIIMDFFYRGGKPNHYRLELLTYNNCELVYAKQFDWLQSMAFFTQKEFSPEVFEQLKPYRNHYIALNARQVSIALDGYSIYELVKLVPNQDKLQQIPAENIHQLNDMYIATLNLLEIPEYFFDDVPFLNVAYKADLSLKYTRQWEMKHFPSVKISALDNESSFYAVFNHTIDVPYMLNPESTYVEKERDMYLDIQAVTDKLKKMLLTYQTNTQSYHVTLEGISEKISLNIFKQGSASFKAKDFKLDYSLSPTNQTIPEPFQLQKMTQAEFNYFVKQLLNQYSNFDGMGLE